MSAWLVKTQLYLETMQNQNMKHKIPKYEAAKHVKWQ